METKEITNAGRKILAGFLCLVMVQTAPLDGQAQSSILMLNEQGSLTPTQSLEEVNQSSQQPIEDVTMSDSLIEEGPLSAATSSDQMHDRNIFPSQSLDASDISDGVSNKYPVTVAASPAIATAVSIPRGARFDFETKSVGWAGAGFWFDDNGPMDLSAIDTLKIGLQGKGTESVKLEVVDAANNKSFVYLNNIRDDREQVWAIDTDLFNDIDTTRVRYLYFIVEGQNKSGGLEMNIKPVQQDGNNITPNANLTNESVTQFPAALASDGSLLPAVTGIEDRSAFARIEETRKGALIKYDTSTSGWAAAGIRFDDFGTQNVETADLSVMESLVFGIQGNPSSLKLEVIDVYGQRAIVYLRQIENSRMKYWQIYTSTLSGIDLTRVSQIYFVVEGAMSTGTFEVEFTRDPNVVPTMINSSAAFTSDDIGGLIDREPAANLALPTITSVSPSESRADVSLTPTGEVIDFDIAPNSWAGGGWSYDHFGTPEIESVDLSAEDEIIVGLQYQNLSTWPNGPVKMEIIDAHGNKQIFNLNWVSENKESYYRIPTAYLKQVDITKIRLVYFIFGGHWSQNFTGQLVVNRRPTLPKGWSFARSNRDYAFRTIEENGYEKLQLMDVVKYRAGQPDAVTDLTSVRIGSTTFLHAHRDVHPSGKVVVYGTSAPSHPLGGSVTVKSLITPGLEKRFLGNLDLQWWPYGRVQLQIHSAYSSFYEHHILDANTLNVLDHYFEPKPGAEVFQDEETKLVLSSRANQTGTHSLVVFDASRTFNQLDLVGSFPVGTDSNTSMTFYDAALTSTGRKLAIASVSGDHIKVSKVIDPFTAEELVLDGIITSASYRGDIAILDLLRQDGSTSTVNVDLTSLTVTGDLPSGYVLSDSNPDYAFKVVLEEGVQTSLWLYDVQSRSETQLQQLSLTGLRWGNFSARDVSPDGRIAVYGVSAGDAGRGVSQIRFVKIDPAVTDAEIDALNARFLRSTLRSIDFSQNGMLKISEHYHASIDKVTHINLNNYSDAAERYARINDDQLIRAGDYLIANVRFGHLDPNDANNLTVFDARMGDDQLLKVAQEDVIVDGQGTLTFAEVNINSNGHEIVTGSIDSGHANRTLVFNMTTGARVTLPGIVNSSEVNGDRAVYQITLQDGSVERVGVDLVTLETGPVILPVPERWSVAPSNQNYAYFVGDKGNAGLPDSYCGGRPCRMDILQVLDRRTGETTRIDYLSTSAPARLGGPVDISSEQTPGGPVVIWTSYVSTTSPGSHKAIRFERLGDPSQRLSISADPIPYDPFVRNLDMSTEGKAVVTTYVAFGEGDDWRYGTQLEYTYHVNLGSLEIEGEIPVKLLNADIGWATHLDGTFATMASRDHHRKTKLLVFDTTRGTDDMRQLRTVSVGEDLGGPYKRFDHLYKDMIRNDQGEAIVVDSVTIDTSASYEFDVFETFHKTILVNINTDKELRLEGGIIGQSRDGDVLTLELMQNSGVVETVHVNLATLEVITNQDVHVYPGDSIQAAINQADAGDVIYIHPGQYQEQISLKAGITLEGIADQVGNKPHIILTSSLTLRADNVLRNLALSQGNKYTFSVYVPTGSANVVLDGLVLDNGYVYVRQDKTVLRNSTVKRTSGTALYWYAGHGTIEGNVFYSAGTSGYIARLYSYDRGGNVFNGNTIAGSGVSGGTTNQYGLYAYRYGGIADKVVNTIIAGVATDIYVGRLATDVSYSLLGSGRSLGMLTRGAGLLEGVDAQFVDAKALDFNLKATSPAINAGDPNSTRRDMGARQYTNAALAFMDKNQDRLVSSQEILESLRAVFNYLNSGQGNQNSDYDVNGDGYVTPLDLLLLINFTGLLTGDEKTNLMTLVEYNKHLIWSRIDQDNSMSHDIAEERVMRAYLVLDRDGDWLATAEEAQTGLLLAQNALNRGEYVELYDINQDGFYTPLDLLIMINTKADYVDQV